MLIDLRSQEKSERIFEDKRGRKIQYCRAVGQLSKLTLKLNGALYAMINSGRISLSNWYSHFYSLV